MHATDRLERHAEGRRPQAGGQGGAGVFFQFDFLAFDGLAIPRRQAEVALHRHDAGTRAAHRAGTAQQVDVVAGRLFDDLQILAPLADQFAHQGEWAAMQEAAAQRQRGAIRHQRGQVADGQMLA